MMKHATRLMLVVAVVAASVSVVMAGRGKGGGSTGTTALSAAEKEGLLETREQEKLARDVYETLADKYEQAIFGNIAASEQKHTDAVKSLLDKYGIEDPAEGKGIGEFTTPAFTALYKTLVAQGEESLEQALNVGVTIEEMDIDDIKALLKDVKHSDIETVYNNLLSGSYNHLDAFQSALKAM